MPEQFEAIRNLLAQEDVLVVTSQAKPFAILIGLEEGEFKDTVSFVSRIRARLAVARLHREVGTKGLDIFCVEEIAKETRKVSRDRHGGT